MTSISTQKKNGDKYDNGVGQLVEHSFAFVHVLISYSLPVYSTYELLMFISLSFRWALFLIVQYSISTSFSIDGESIT